ncbi:MAG: sigma-70 family RNA polymerase sigma factor [Bacteroidia bacterium]|nr:sigma-70 family RNA polymerase sigma factor [Bacteroidia bacterium]
MRKNSNREIIIALQNGENSVLLGLGKKYFPEARSVLRRRGIRDKDTPQLFAGILVQVYREIRSHHGSTDIPFEPFLFNAIDSFLKDEKARRKELIPGLTSIEDPEAAVAAECLGILEEETRELLFERYSEGFSFEMIAARQEFSNPVIAEAEVDKCILRFEGILRIRLNLNSPDSAAPLTTGERSWVDRYLTGKMDGEELMGFMERLDKEPLFRKSVSLQNLMVEGIRKSADETLEDEIIRSLPFKESKIPAGLTMIFFFLLFVVSGLVLWSTLGPENQEIHNPFSFLNHLKKTEVDGGKDIASSMKAVSPVSVPDPNSVPDEIPDEQTESDPSGNAAVSESNATDSASRQDTDTFYVKQDQLLMSYRMKINQMGDSSAQVADNTSLVAETVRRLNPGAELAIPENNPADNLEVEFWMSPVNYRGYKMSPNTLVLFGIPEPDAVSLYRKNNRILMKYHKEIFILQETGDFLSFQTIKDPELTGNFRP